MLSLRATANGYDDEEEGPRRSHKALFLQEQGGRKLTVLKYGFVLFMLVMSFVVFFQGLGALNKSRHLRDFETTPSLEKTMINVGHASIAGLRKQQLQMKQPSYVHLKMTHSRAATQRWFETVNKKDQSLVRSALNLDPSLVNVTNHLGENALHICARKGHYLYFPDEIPKLLIDSHVDINAQTNSRETALEIAALGGWHRLVVVLLDAGADRAVLTPGVLLQVRCKDVKRVLKEYGIAIPQHKLDHPPLAAATS